MVIVGRKIRLEYTALIFTDWFAKMIASGRNGELGDGVCDVQLDVPECCFDGGDCSTCPSCPFSARQEKSLLKDFVNAPS